MQHAQVKGSVGMFYRVPVIYNNLEDILSEKITAVKGTLFGGTCLADKMTSRQHGWQTSDPQGPGQHSLTLQGTQTPRISRDKKRKRKRMKRVSCQGKRTRLVWFIFILFYRQPLRFLEEGQEVTRIVPA